MKRLIILILTLCCFAAALDYSHRIRALGTEFASLIPDYETDLYRNPYFLDRGMAGISFEPMLVFYYQQSLYQYVIVNQMPFKLRLMTKNLGLMGQYWVNYSHDLEPRDYGWRSSTFKAFRINDVWMCRIRKAVINLYNDLDYAKISYLTSTNSESVENRIEYIAKTQVSLQIRKRLNLDLKLGYGFYENRKEMDQNEIRKQRIKLGLFRIGLYCRNISSANDFLSWYLDIGSPITNTDIDSLPYSVYSHLAESETKFVMFAQTIMARLGIAKALPVTERGFVAIGIKNTFLYQNTQDLTDALDLRGIKNTLSVPLGLEYRINTVSLRFGTRFRYDFGSLHESDDNAISIQSIEHEIGYDYSFGIGWQPHKHLVLDIYNNGSLIFLRNWALYVKYLF
ncbi:MAG: hypothetical protein WBE28_04755 [bacterium]